MKARILIDNLTTGTLRAEWGLSIWIEYDGHTILLDTGASGRFAENAEAMGLDLGRVEFGVLSHAHYDHADGLAAFFEKNDSAAFYLREGARENCYGKKWIFHKYIGIHRGFLEKYKDKIIFAEGSYEIIPGVTLLPHRTPGLEKLGKQNQLYVKEGGRYRPDTFAHEQSLVLDTKKGLVIFNSCSHAGADNIIQEVSEAYPDKDIHALIGGFHLYHTSEKEIRALAERIKQMKIQRIYTGHCTGEPAFRILKEELKERAYQIYTGMEIAI